MSRTCCGSAKRQIFHPARSRSGVSQWDARLWQSSRRALEHRLRLLPPIILSRWVTDTVISHNRSSEVGRLHLLKITTQTSDVGKRITLEGRLVGPWIGE